MTLYVDGLVSTAIPRALSTTQVPTIHIGSWWQTNGANVVQGASASCAIAVFRFHTGTLTAADVAFNYNQFQATLLAAGSIGFGTTASGPMTLATAGYQRVMLTGTGFQPPASYLSGGAAAVTVTYTAASPFSAGATITYPAGVDPTTSNATALIITTSPGVGPAISFTITVNSGPLGSALPPVMSTTLAIASYAPPTITSFSPLGTWSAGGLANPNGGDSFALIGTSFGPLTLPGVPLYTPTVTYFKASGGFTAINCVRSTTSPQTAITCQTAPGAGSKWPLYVCVGATGQCSALVGSVPPSISYPPPTITSLYGALSMNTAGGESLVATGTGFGTPSTVGAYTVMLQYGPAALAANGTWLYNGSLCALVSVSTTNSAMQVCCCLHNELRWSCKRIVGLGAIFDPLCSDFAAVSVH